MSGFLSSLFTPRPAALSLTDDAAWREAGLLTMNPAAGVTVTPGTALTYAAVLTCVRVLAESVASLPLIMYQRTGDTKERARDFYLYRLLHDQPNPLMTSFQYRETAQSHLLLWGNAYSEIEFIGGRIAALWPLNPAKMERIELVDGELTYHYRLPNGKSKTLPGWRVWHLRGLGDGLMGYSPIALARQAVGMGLATEKYGAQFFANGARPGGVLTTPNVLGDEAHARLKDSWNAAYGGLDNAQRTAILEEGLTYKAIGIPPEEAQFLETRKFQRSEIAAIYRVPPHMAGDLEHATFSNIEHQAIEFVTHSLRPWLVRWEQSINTNLLTTGQQQRYYAEFLVDALLRGDILSRFQAYAIARQNGWYSADDIRAKENENPLPGGQGKMYLVPLNMVPADQAGNQASNVTPGARAHYRLLAEEAAGRVVRKEIAAMSRAAERTNGDREAWGTAVLDFYGEHAQFVAQTMRISLASAKAYADVGQSELLIDGAESMADWQPRRVMELADLATEVNHD